MPEKILGVGVHIWAPGRVAAPGRADESLGRPAIENNTAYVAARTHRLSQGSQRHILLVAEGVLHDTIEILGLDKEWDNRLIKTHLGSPRPIGGDFRSLREFILDQFPADGYEFWGTELYLDKNGKPKTGCVKGAFDNLKLPNSRIDIASCWTAPMPKGNPWRNNLANALSPGWLMP